MCERARSWGIMLWLLGFQLMILASVEAFDFGYTGRRKELLWPKPSPVQQEAEKALLLSSVLIKRGEYCDGEHLSDHRRAEIQNESSKYSMTLEQALSLRKQALVTKVVTANKKIRPRLGHLARSFGNGKNILELSMETDLPPMSIIRAIITRRIKKKVPSMHERDIRKLVKQHIADGYGKYLKSTYEEDQVSIAKIFDQTSYSDPLSLERQLSSGWEISLHDFLDQHEVEYLKEADLRDDMEQHATPDVLFRDDVRINGVQVRWIDSKNYFGGVAAAGPGPGRGGHFIKKLTKQIKKYDTEYQASGAIVYRLGYSESLLKLVGASTLLLDKGPLHSPVVPPSTPTSHSSARGDEASDSVA